MSLNKFRKFNLVDEQKKNFFRSQISSWLIEHPSVNPYTFTWNGFSRKITSRFRMLPSFLIIGGAKCGTTSLYAHLIEHPNILSASIKEVNFFQYIQNSKTSFYRSHFPIKRQNLITGEASTQYLVHRFVSKRVHELLPSVKLILLVRNPVERAYSEFYYMINLGAQITDNFEDAIESELRRIKIEDEKPEFTIENSNYNHFQPAFSYLRHGIYSNYILNWLKSFPKEQLLILNTKDLYNNLGNTLDKTFQFLNLPKYQIENKIPKNKIDKIRPIAGRVSNIYKNINSKTQTLFNVQNYPEMKPKTRKSLQDFYRPYNEKLFEIIGRRFDWND
tara:strand:- start:229 stop:1227 length:999 start_codon:yes stop_codon:yes gene_type:complete